MTVTAPTPGTGPPLPRGVDLPPPLARAPRPPGRRLRGLLWRCRVPLAATCLGLAAATAVESLRPPPPETVPVVVLAHDVPAGTALRAEDVAVVALPPRDVPVDALRRAESAVGGVTSVALPARLPVTPHVLSAASLTGPPGTVVAAVRLGDPAVAELLSPGTHVDLLAARPEGGPGATVAHRALVLPSPERPSAPGGLLGGAGPGDDVPPLLLAVDPAEALHVAEASASSVLMAVAVP